jgi:hypothetical protein
MGLMEVRRNGHPSLLNCSIISILPWIAVSCLGSRHTRATGIERGTSLRSGDCLKMSHTCSGQCLTGMCEYRRRSERTRQRQKVGGRQPEVREFQSRHRMVEFRLGLLGHTGAIRRLVTGLTTYRMAALPRNPCQFRLVLDRG